MIQLTKQGLITVIILCIVNTGTYSQERNEAAKIKVDLSKEKGNMTPIWAWFVTTNQTIPI